MRFIDKLNEIIGRTVAWLVILMVLGTLYNVIARYFFSSYSVELGELVIIMNSMVFLLAAPWLLHLDLHVRVDVFYSRLSTRQQAVIDFLGTLLLLLPFCAVIIFYSWHYVVSSWEVYEASSQTSGLPGLYLVKSLIILVAVLLFLQGISLLVQKYQLFKNPKQEHPEHHHEEFI